MTPSDIGGSAFVIGCGLWWALFPNSVVRLYEKTLGRSFQPEHVRNAGWVWLVFVCIVLWWLFGA